VLVVFALKVLRRSQDGICLGLIKAQFTKLAFLIQWKLEISSSDISGIDVGSKMCQCSILFFFAIPKEAENRRVMADFNKMFFFSHTPGAGIITEVMLL